jgi:SAM-dependent methyltransferase
MGPLASRRHAAERMDDPALDARAHAGALAGLARINLVSGTAASLWPPLARLTRGRRPLRVLDLACGAGDVAIGLERRARRSGLGVEVHGCDVSPRAVEHARARAAARGAGARFFACDVLGDGFPRGYDVYTCSLFLHHLREGEAVELLRRMATGRALLVSDLERRRAGYWAAYLGTRCLTRSAIVHEDATTSVAGAFTSAELRALAGAAGLDGARLRRLWPFRMLLEWVRP